MSSQWECQFGGGLQTLPEPVAWGLIGLIGVAGFALIVFLYRHTLREITPFKRRVLTTLRIAMLLAVLACLANPALVNHTERKRDVRRKLAVVIDRSASMNALDNRSETRLGNALHIWKQHPDEALQNFDLIDYYRFSTKLDKAAGLDEAVQANDPGPETRLYDSLNHVLDDSLEGIVCLTDGLDTTDGDVTTLVDHAQRQGVPLYFVAGRNRTRPTELLSIREIRVPSRVLRHSQFTAGAAIEIASGKDRELPVELWSGDKKIASAKLNVRAGWNVLPWTTEISSGEAGPMPLEFRVGEGGNCEIAGSTTQVIEKTTVDILYYQGALQWGYRFLLSALQSDPSFKLESILNPALHLQMTTASDGEHVLTDLPEDAAALKHFQVVVLAHVLADQLSVKQQQALVDYAKGGGSVLFITPDTLASEQFAGTLLEKMLPIVFERPSQQSAENQAEETFQQHMKSIGGSNSGQETIFAGEAMRSSRDAQDLVPFASPTGAKSSKLFQSGSNAPMFSTYAQVSNVKPGAEVLAVHPNDKTPDGKVPRVLVARQRFGDGRSAAMTTDLLWRWKMSLPSDSHVVETFWQQFMLSLAPASTGEGLRLMKKTDLPSVNHAVALQVEGASEELPKIVATSPTGVQKPVYPTQESGGGKTGTLQANFTPDTEGRWEVRATDTAGNNARITLNVSAQVRTTESVNLPPDVEGMRRIAEATGGALIEDGAPVFHSQLPQDQSSEIKYAQPLWNNGWLIGILLGLYGAELITRRCFRLL
ncbi:MAG: hypothetical protein WCD79_00530 [Chthoniobacteraceae bacterium]